jgi:PAS domain S-box-containing protein
MAEGTGVEAADGPGGAAAGRVALPSAREVLRALYEAVLLCSADGRVVEANARALKLFGAAETELQDRPISDLVLGLGSDLLASVLRSLDEGRFTVLDAYCRRPNGTSFAAEAAISRLPVGDAPPLLLLAVRNVERRRRAEQALRREAEAQIARARGQDEFAGLLHVVTIPDVVQLVEAARKTGRLTVADAAGAVAGEVWFLDGQVVRAACGGRTGEEAFLALVASGGASFRFAQETCVERDPAVRRATLALLFEAARLADEGGTPAPAP